jgi:tRNA uridine 5-carboxymethylaminomethyl modification enzyme
MPIGYKVGLVSRETIEKLERKIEQIDAEIKRVSTTNVSPSAELNQYLLSKETSELSTGCKMADLIRRPQLNYVDLKRFDPNRPELSDEVCEQVELEIKYEGYISKQLAQIEQMRRFENKIMPKKTDYSRIRGLRLEAAEKLNRVKPLSLGQASRISGVSPADINLLAVWLHQETEG